MADLVFGKEVFCVNLSREEVDQHNKKEISLTGHHQKVSEFLGKVLMVIGGKPGIIRMRQT